MASQVKGTGTTRRKMSHIGKFDLERFKIRDTRVIVASGMLTYWMISLTLGEQEECRLGKAGK